MQISYYLTNFLFLPKVQHNPHLFFEIFRKLIETNVNEKTGQIKERKWFQKRFIVCISENVNDIVSFKFNQRIFDGRFRMYELITVNRVHQKFHRMISVDHVRTNF